MPAVVVFAVGCFFPNLPSRKQITTTRIHPLRACLFEGFSHPGWGGCAWASAAQGAAESCSAECSCIGQVLLPESCLLPFHVALITARLTLWTVFLN